MRRRIAHGLAIVLSVVSLGAAQKAANSELNTRSSPHSTQPLATIGKKTPKGKKVAKAKPYQIGTASWYGSQFHGKVTASGEPFDMYQMTAAHPTLPLGTVVLVTNLRNGKTAVVRINDRGPIVPGRIIDLSYQAARALDMKAWGIQLVRLDLVPPPALAMAQPVADLQ